MAVGHLLCGHMTVFLIVTIPVTSYEKEEVTLPKSFTELLRFFKFRFGWLQFSALDLLEIELAVLSLDVVMMDTIGFNSEGLMGALAYHRGRLVRKSFHHRRAFTNLRM